LIFFHQRRVCIRFAQHWSKPLLFKAFELLYSKISHNKHVFKACLHSLSVMVNRFMQVVFYSWKVDTMSGIRRRKIPVSVVVKWFLRLGSIVFSAWRSRIRFEMECHQKMADVLHRLVIRSLFLSFDYWHFQAYQLGHQRKFSTHMVQIWTQLTLLEAFRSWMDNVKHKNQVGVIGGKVALRVLNFTTATVFASEKYTRYTVVSSWSL